MRRFQHHSTRCHVSESSRAEKGGPATLASYQVAASCACHTPLSRSILRCTTELLVCAGRPRRQWPGECCLRATRAPSPPPQSPQPPTPRYSGSTAPDRRKESRSLTRTSSACSLLIARSFGFLVLLLEFYIASALVRTSELRLYMRPRQGLYTVYHRGTWTCKPYYVKWSVVSKGYMQ